MDPFDLLITHLNYKTVVDVSAVFIIQEPQIERIRFQYAYGPFHPVSQSLYV